MFDPRPVIGMSRHVDFYKNITVSNYNSEILIKKKIKRC